MMAIVVVHVRQGIKTSVSLLLIVMVRLAKIGADRVHVVK